MADLTDRIVRGYSLIDALIGTVEDTNESPLRRNREISASRTHEGLDVTSTAPGVLT